MPSIPLLDLHQYHAVDRSLFVHLVMHLSRDPAETMLAMAFWFWLEDNSLPCLVTRLLRAPNFVVNKVADEARLCLNSLAADQPMPAITQTPFTTAIMGDNIPLDMMHADKPATVNGIKYYLTDVCARIFTDILDQVIIGNSADRPFYHTLNVPGFPHPIFGDVTILKLPLSEIFPVDDLWGWSIPEFLPEFSPSITPNITPM
ncbi:hypothetical protein SOVF_151480 [Spinacia oleracea]|uniref:Aminotransferase-like plant mobile domain-containing protein n=1 Tax=Spinacia oleracea TaxID=3562 RepID=A0A9R0IGA1_SPIOL|nr:uncharacterized protein LOC110788402 [Spinacia oleracea]KNA09677.1 hypothetical protein SOVF_151480 [Spinacia oleracea]